MYALPAGPLPYMTQSKAEQNERELRHSPWWQRAKNYLKALGPGLITGASDDDPSGIGTYAQTGAQFGYTQLWMALYTLPLTAAVQEICARVALETGDGLANVLRKYYPRPVVYIGIALLFIANTINIGADLGAMAAAARLLLPIPFIVVLLGFTVVIVALQIFVDYNRYARLLRLLTLSLLAYCLIGFAVHQDWGQALQNTVLPTIQFDRGFLLNLVAVLGTTISPYLFFWQASQEVEEEIDEGRTTEAARRGVTDTELKWMRTDVFSGMAFSNIVMWFIILGTASTLFRAGIYQVDSADKAAQALQPVAGQFAALLFAAGIVGTGLLAVPVLAGSAAYALAETWRWPEGLSLKLPQAPAFYGAITLATVLGAAMNLIGLNPIQALYGAAVINGLVAPPLLVLLMLISNNPHIMHKRINGSISNILGWLTTIAMTLAAIALLAAFLIPTH